MLCQFLLYSKVTQFYIHIFSHIVYHTILYIAPCDIVWLCMHPSRTLLFTHHIYTSLHLLITKSESFPSQYDMTLLIILCYMTPCHSKLGRDSPIDMEAVSCHIIRWLGG